MRLFCGHLKVSEMQTYHHVPTHSEELSDLLLPVLCVLKLTAQIGQKSRNLATLYLFIKVINTLSFNTHP